MRKDRLRREALVYHAKPQPGKIKILPSKRYATQRDLALAYSPGVAEPCLEIEKDVNNAYKYTIKRKLSGSYNKWYCRTGIGRHRA